MFHQVFILCAGSGNRLGNPYNSYPKSLIPIGSTNLLQNHIKNCKYLNLNDITILTGYKKRYFESFPYPKQHNKFWQKTNMFYTLTLCSSKLAKSNSVILYGDIAISRIDLENLLDAPGDINILYDLNWLKYWRKRMKKPQLDVESFNFIGSEVVEIGKRNPKLFNVNGQYVGALAISTNGWNILHDTWRILPNKNQVSFTEILNVVIKNKYTRVIGIPLEKKWIEIDSPTDLRIAKRIIKYL